MSLKLPLLQIIARPVFGRENVFVPSLTYNGPINEEPDEQFTVIEFDVKLIELVFILH